MKGLNVSDPAKPRSSSGADPAADAGRRKHGLRWLLAGLACLVAVAVATGVAYAGELGELASFKTIGLNYDALRRLVEANYGLAALAYLGLYALIGLFLLPGSPVLAVLSGLLFGHAVGIPLSIVGSTVAATLGFTMARLTVGRSVGVMSNPVLDRLRAGFARHALSYMMFLRLTPGLPFGVVNVAPAMLGVPLSTFAIGTTVGMLPSRIALSTAGAGLATVIDRQNVQYSQCLATSPPGTASCSYDIDVASLLTNETLAAFVALAVLALVPAMMDAAPRVWRRPGSKQDADV